MNQMITTSKKTNIFSKVSEVLKILPARSQDVLTRRFGLKTGKIETQKGLLQNVMH